MTVLIQLWAFLRRDWRLARSLPLTLVWQLLTVVFGAPTLYYLGRLVQPSASPHLAPYGGDYFAFAIPGIACSGFFAAMMGAWASGMRSEYLAGTLDAVFQTPASVLVLSAGASLWSTCVAAAQAALYLAVGTIVFHVSFPQANGLSLLLIFALTALVFAPLGMAAAALSLVFRSGDPLTGVLAGMSALLAGIFYPTTVLPPALQRAAQWLPLTHSLQATRLALLKGASAGALGEELTMLALFAVVVLPCGIVSLYLASALIKRLGTITGQ
jgi:ABC-2 type transport system permease protein